MYLACVSKYRNADSLLCLRIQVIYIDWLMHVDGVRDYIRKVLKMVMNHTEYYWWSHKINL